MIISSKKEEAMINQKCVLRGFSKYFLRRFLIKRERLLIPYDYFREIPNIKSFYFPELYAHKIGRILF